MSDQQPPIKNYEMVASADAHRLSKRVTELIEQGYQPYGDPNHVHDVRTGETVFSQAMVEYMTLEEAMEQALSMFVGEDD